jgi:hypothetical protein
MAGWDGPGAGSRPGVGPGVGRVWAGYNQRKFNSALAEFPGCDCHGDSVAPESRLVTCG